MASLLSGGGHLLFNKQCLVMATVQDVAEPSAEPPYSVPSVALDEQNTAPSPTNPFAIISL